MLSIIDQLPATSRYAEAVSQDEEVAAELADVDLPSAPVPLSTWTPEVAEMRIMNERLGHLGQLLGVLAHNPYTPTPLPRPVAARERVRRSLSQSRAEAVHRRTRAQLLPDQYPDGGVSDADLPS